MKYKGIKMFKKTLIAAALTAATASTAFAGDIAVSGTAYNVGNEYLGAYTGSALEGDLEGNNAIDYTAGIALGVDNTLKFVFGGGAIAADTSLKLQVSVDATVQAAVAAAVNAVVDSDGNNDAADLAAAQLAATNATAAIVAEQAALTPARVVVIAATDAAIGGAGSGATFADTQANIIAAAVGAPATSVSGVEVADLVDFGVDGNGDYEWVLFKLTSATLVSEVLTFNDTDTDASANVVTKFTKETIGTGDLTVAMTEAKDGTGAALAAPVASAQTLVTTTNQFSVVTTTANDTIDVEQDREHFASATDAVTTANFNFDVTVNAVDLGITDATSTFVAEIAGNLTSVTGVTYTDGANNGSFDSDNELAGTGVIDAVAAVTVAGDVSLDTRDITFSLTVTPSDADTEAFVLVDPTTVAFSWDLNGSEITFPYAPIGYTHITTNFELANSGDQEGDILLTAFSRDGESFSGTMTQKAEAGSLVKLGEQDIYDALDLTEGTSLSLTVTTTAPQDDIKVTGYSNIAEKGGRMTLLSDAYETAECTATSVVTNDGLTTESTDVTVTCD